MQNFSESKGTAYCRCQDKNGSDVCEGGAVCPEYPYQCKKGYFGYRCFYRDIAWESIDQLYPSLTNGLYPNGAKDCHLFPFGVNFKIKWSSEFTISWIRIILGGKAKTFKSTVNEIYVSGDCVNPKKSLFEQIIDVYCDPMSTTTSVTFTFNTLIEVCKVYVSQGRNIFDTAVPDILGGQLTSGNLKDGFDDDLTTCFTMSRSADNWNISLSLNLQQSFGFDFRSFKKSVYFKHDNKTKVALVVESSKSSCAVCRAQTSSANEQGLIHVECPFVQGENILQLQIVSLQKEVEICEIQIFGEDVCPKSRWGPHCLNECHCRGHQEPCFPQSGGCGSSCSSFYTGVDCNFRRIVNGKKENSFAKMHCNTFVKESEKSREILFFQEKTKISRKWLAKNKTNELSEVEAVLKNVSLIGEGSFHCYTRDSDGNTRRAEGNYLLVFDDDEYQCQVPYIGSRCSIKCHCRDHVNASTCFTGEDYKTCVCAEGYTGQLCDTTIQTLYSKSERKFKFKCAFGSSFEQLNQTVWKKDQLTIELDQRVYQTFSLGNYLVIEQTSVNDSGVYQCHVTFNNYTWSDLAVKLLVYDEEMDIFTHVLEFIGKDVVLYCLLEGSSFDRYLGLQWEKDGEHLSSSTDNHRLVFKTVPVPSLTIYNLSASDSGQYWCYSTQQPATHTGLPVYLQAEEYSTGEDILVTLLQDAVAAQIPCAPTNQSTVALLWHKLEPKPSMEWVKVQEGGPHLNIANVSKQHSGRYRCCYVLDDGKYSWTITVFSVAVTKRPKRPAVSNQLPDRVSIDCDRSYPKDEDYYQEQREDEKQAWIKKRNNILKKEATGVRCSETCYIKSCDLKGNCLECLPGFYGPSCSKSCNTSALCDREGNYARKCPPGFYGFRCMLLCETECADNMCSNFLGLCLSCKKGYYGALCNQKCPVVCIYCSRSGECFQKPDSLFHTLFGLVLFAIMVGFFYICMSTFIFKSNLTKATIDELSEF